jgi:hypothetical protein
MTQNLLAQSQIIYNPAINSRIGVMFNMRNSAAAVQRIIQVIIDVALAFAGVYFMFNLIRGGYEFITAGGDKESVQTARKRIVNALIGIVVVFSVYAFVFLMETLFGIPIRSINIPNI